MQGENHSTLPERPDLRRDVKEIVLGDKDLKSIKKSVQLTEAFERFKQQMDAAKVAVTHYVDWNQDKINKNLDAWNKLQKRTKELGVKLINVAK